MADLTRKLSQILTNNQIYLANTGVTPGGYGSANQIPSIVVDQDGRIASISNTAVSIPSGAYADSNNVIFTNNTLVTSNVTIQANTGNMSVGPVRFATGITLSMGANSRYLIF